MQNREESRPVADMNMTPLIDVLLVLLVMFIITIPLATHSVDIDVQPCHHCSPPDLQPTQNRVVIDPSDRILWNGKPISEGELALALDSSLSLPIEPELQFAPDALASYERAARVLNIIHASGVTNFGFVGNDQFRTFGT